jgi:transposase
MTPRETELTALLARCQQDLASALGALAKAQEIIARQEKEIARLGQENTLLRQKVDLLARRIFGAKSEKISAEQLELLLQWDQEGRAKKPAAAGPVPAVEPAAPRRRKPAKKRGPRALDHLPVETTVIDPPEVTADPEAWRCIGEISSEQVDYTPACYIKRRLVRRKFVRTDHPFNAPVVAALPGRLLDRSLPAPGLLAHIIVSKYCDHLPLYRQEQIARTRHGVDLPRQTLARWLQMAAGWLALVYGAIKDEVLGGGYVQADETPIKYLEPGNGKARQGYFWTFLQPGGSVFFSWQTSRAAACLESIIPFGNKPLKMGVDACSGYPCFSRSRPSGAIILCGCLCHARREFTDGKEQDPRVAGVILLQFRRLYAIEAELRESRASPGQRLGRRQADSRPVLDRLRRIMQKLQSQGRFLPQSQLGKAVSYFLNQWDTFQEFLKDGRVEIDNNLVENAIRPTAIGKKNWLFIGCAGAGQAGAILFTIVENCRQRGLDPWRYLRDVLTLLPEARNTDIAALLPAAWAQTQAARKAA